MPIIAFQSGKLVSISADLKTEFRGTGLALDDKSLETGSD